MFGLSESLRLQDCWSSQSYELVPHNKDSEDEKSDEIPSSSIYLDEDIFTQLGSFENSEAVRSDFPRMPTSNLIEPDLSRRLFSEESLFRSDNAPSVVVGLKRRTVFQDTPISSDKKIFSERNPGSVKGPLLHRIHKAFHNPLVDISPAEQLGYLERAGTTKVAKLAPATIRITYYSILRAEYSNNKDINHINGLYRSSIDALVYIFSPPLGDSRFCNGTANKVRKIARWKGFTQQEIGDKNSLKIDSLVKEIIYDDLCIVFHILYNSMGVSENSINGLWEKKISSQENRFDKAKIIRLWIQKTKIINQESFQKITYLFFPKEYRLRSIPKELTKKLLPNLEKIYISPKSAPTIRSNIFLTSLHGVEMDGNWSFNRPD